MNNKKELIKEYKQTLRKMGVYAVKNTANGKIFVGSSKDINGKLNSAKFQLEHGSHMNSALQKEFNESGGENFTFEILDLLEPKTEPGYDYTRDLTALENLWLENLEPYGEKGYNKKK